MARTYSTPTVARALDAAMFLTPAGLPATEFKRELEHRLIDACQFASGRGIVPRKNVVRIKTWEDRQFWIGLGTATLGTSTKS